MLTPRKQKILDCIINYYIKYGEPVGSKLIAGEIGVSSATVRNEMAELTEEGLLEQLHTSSGRIPSGLGFRSYIKNRETAYIDAQKKSIFDTLFLSCGPDELLKKAASTLAGDYACIISEPGDKSTVIKAIQFAQISRRTALLILLSSAGTAKTRVFKCDFDLNQEMLRIFFRAFNEKLMGISLSEITPAFLQNFAISLGELSILMSSAIVALYESVEETSKAELIVKGQTKLFMHNSLSAQTLLAFSELINNPEQFRETLMRRTTKISVILGGDPIFPQLSDAGIVSAKYSIDKVDSGIISVIGPLRMDYPKVISELKYVANYVGESLTAFIKEEI